MRESIQQHLDRKEAQERMRQAALMAWNTLQANCLHVTASEADAWLSRLEGAEDADPPECHG